MTWDDTRGLTTKEAEKRLIEYGENRLEGKKKTSVGKIFISQFRDVMILILLGATVLSVLMGETTEALTIVAIVLLNALLGFFQEYRTEKTLEALEQLAAPMSQVLRDGVRQQIPAEQLVPGDLVYLKAGDRVPADMQLLEASALACDESLITGESAAVEKTAGRDSVLMGTLVTKGTGTALVTGTGMQTEMGKIAGMLDEIEEDPTPLQLKLDQLGRYIGIGCLVICGIVSVTGILRGENILDMLIVGISLAVAAVPEGLPAIVTISLALAVGRILKKNAVIRKLHAVETLGCADVICSDKTGTLTENKMTVTALSTPEADYQVTGSGHEVSGGFFQGKQQAAISSDPAAMCLMEIANNCNNAELQQGLQEPKGFFSARPAPPAASGEPTEIALKILAAKAGVNRMEQRLKEVPFDSGRKLMTVVVRLPDGGSVTYTKGAPDFLLERCTHCLTRAGVKVMTAQMRQKIEEKNDAMASQALRVIGFAYGRGDLSASEKGLTFVGLAGMIDPPRREAYAAVERCRQAGIKPVMITGDHKNTAVAIARDLKIYHKGDQVLTGKEIDRMSDAELTSVMESVSVCARVSPANKLRIVQTLKNRGHVVAMTGDGVNDAPAVKEASIGVAMGQGGTDVTKEASSLILLDDNFATLVSAVEEGRAIYQNIRKFIRYLLSCNIGEVITMFVGMLMGLPVVLLPIQILIINLLTDGLPAIALGLEPPEEDIMYQKPRKAKDSIFSGGLAFTILIRGCMIGLSTLVVFIWLARDGYPLEYCRTAALLTLVVTQLFHVFECKSEKKTLFSVPLGNNLFLLAAVAVSAGVILLAIYHPVCQQLFDTVALSAGTLGKVFFVSLIAPIISAISMKIR